MPPVQAAIIQTEANVVSFCLTYRCVLGFCFDVRCGLLQGNVYNGDSAPLHKYKFLRSTVIPILYVLLFLWVRRHVSGFLHDYASPTRSESMLACN